MQVVDAIYDCKSEVIGPGAYRFKAEIGKASAIIQRLWPLSKPDYLISKCPSACLIELLYNSCSFQMETLPKADQCAYQAVKIREIIISCMFHFLTTGC